ncbi:hypothetical protein LPB140_10445 [Sphingorhabdus lutea]|uniref:Uncharacterized protein n=1 Tax=Sphingorhabdus lutea TaxID=1913578 RepID=A0A1L3JDC1_9SPHN|nr:hypothetical protein [Sphingorhabdus lutea]APG63136.1 hypothetical protein LPB140_10445 [Sphingorhabdus lutea]
MEGQNLVICVGKAEALLSRRYKQNLAKRIKQLGLSRPKTTDWLADTIYGFLEDGGIIVDGRGNELIVGDETIDRSYYCDQAFSWNSDIKRFADQMPQRRSSARILTRLMLFDAAFKITALNSPQNQIATFSCLRNSRCSLCAANDQLERIAS